MTVRFSSTAAHAYEKARSRMVREQLEPRGVTDPAVLATMNRVPRHCFVDDALQSQAYGDFSLPIGEGQTISQPYVVALMTQLLELTGEDTVLEIGTGCGYQTAILADLCERVYTVERIKSLHARARRAFDKLHIFNVLCKIDDGTLGWPENGPYDKIIVTAAGPSVPAPLVAQLADPGVLVIPVGERGNQKLVMVRKQDGEVTERIVEDVKFVSLIGDHGWQG